jgi:hypothetical protein
MATELPALESASTVLPRPTAPLSNSMRQAFASVRVEGLVPNEAGMDLIRRGDRGELTSEQALEAYSSHLVID